MKRIMIFLAATCLVCCDRADEIDEATPGQSLELSVGKISFDRKGNVMAGSENSVSVTSSADWRLIGNASWCAPSTEEGQNGATVTFTAAPNETEEIRETTLVFICGNVSKEFVVSQYPDGYVEYMNDVKDSYAFEAAGGGIFIRLNSNLDAGEPILSQEWITLSRPGSSASGEQWIQVQIGASPVFATRTGAITLFPGTEIERVITVEQKAYTGVRTDDPVEYLFVDKAGTFTIVATGDVSFTTVTESISADWITVTETSSSEVGGLLQKTYRIDCAASDYNRQGIVKLVPQSGTGFEIVITMSNSNPYRFEIPDNNLASFLVKYGYVIGRTDGKYELTYEGYALTELDFSNYWEIEAKSLQGIEAFVNLRSLCVESLPVSVLDLSGSTKLTALSVYAIPLAELILGDINVTTLSLSYLNYYNANPIGSESLTVSGSKLETLQVNEKYSWNEDYLKEINVVNCPKLKKLECTRVSGKLERIYIAAGQQITITTSTGVQIIEVSP